MNLLFICGSIENGRNGVGDYARVLALEGVAHGHSITLLSLRDPFVRQPTFAQEGEIRTVRLPKVGYLKSAAVAAELGTYDFISLQIVTFAFHVKGLPYGFLKPLQRHLSGKAWHFMFHELWLGLAPNDNLKFKLWGLLQKQILKSWIRNLRPALVHTQSQYYVKILESAGIKARLLPLFGNIPLHEGNGWQILNTKLGATKISLSERKNRVLAGIFGSVHPEWIRSFKPELLAGPLQASGKKVAFVFLGDNRLTNEEENTIRQKVAPYGEVWKLGRLDKEEISPILAELDLGLPTSPPTLLEKSGTAVSMMEHGLPLGLFREAWPDDGLPKDHLAGMNAFALSNSHPETMPLDFKKKSHGSRIPLIAEQFYTELNELHLSD